MDDFSYTLDSTAFSHGDVNEPEQTLINTVSAYALNDSDEPKQIIVDLHFEQSTQWRKTNSFDLSESVMINENFTWPQVGKTDVTVKLEQDQRFSETNNGSRSEPTELQAIITVPANSVLPFRVEF